MYNDVVFFALIAGIGLGWIASWFFVVRPERDTVRDMRFAGFVHDRPAPPRKLKAEEPLTRNET